jgi:hypothetical protein
MQPTVLHVFVSSTWLDLQPERAAVETALQRLRETKFVGMEYFGSRDEDTRRARKDRLSDLCSAPPSSPPWAERRPWRTLSTPSRTWAAGGRRLESLRPLRGADGAEGWCHQRVQRNSAHSAVPGRG